LARYGRQWQRKNETLAVIALASGSSVRDAANKSGVSERTLFRRVKDSKFQDDVNNARREIIENSLSKLIELSEKAVNTLEQLLQSDNQTVRIAAAKFILQGSLELRREVEFESRISYLEKMLEAYTNEES
jgi:hypothetical protein